MKKLRPNPRNNRTRKVACTVSAAALMLGVSHAATVGMHFQENYCGSAAYSGYPVTLTAFGIAPAGWQNLTQMNTGYGSCALTSPPYGYTFNETITTSTSTGGLNPLPNGSLTVNWFGPTANFDPFYGYAGSAPNYSGGGPLVSPTTGEQQIYATFIRDGVNFGPPGGADNTANPGGYSVDITGLKTVFPTTPFVVELIASSDSMQVLTNAFVIDMVGLTTNSVTYPSTPPVSDSGGAPWVRGTGGGLSTGTGSINTDHIKIISNKPQHGGTGTPPTGFDNAGTISGYIITDKPVVTMSPRSVLGNPGDSVTLNPYAIGVPPLAYQWRKNGSAVSGATTSTLAISGLNLAKSGNYDLVVTNLYGKATSSVAAVTVDMIKLTHGSGFIVDSNTVNPERDGLNNGATWVASSSDGIKTRTGVMQFVAANTNGITVPGSTNFDSSTGTIMFWMRSAGTDTGASGSIGAALFGRPGSSLVNDFVLVQEDSGNILFNAPGTANVITSGGTVSDNKWHLIALTYDQSVSGSASLYIDGVLDTANPNSAAWSAPVGKEIEIGFNSVGGLRAYDGLLDEVRVYNRQLTGAEITSVFNTAALIDTSALQMQFSFTTAPVPGLTLSWGATSSVLQSAPVANGTYTDVNAAVSPYYVVPKGTQKYYRYRFPNAPQSLTSNPYLM